ncbi:MAG: ABC transporter permease subunit [Chloroflexi bacterium]|nr:ABC transporter permease subunit [Chloroflexota bacterium]
MDEGDRAISSNRLAILGSIIASVGYFFLPLLVVVPNAISPQGVSFQLLELQGDYRYPFLFFLSLLPFAVALQSDVVKRGWLLVGMGNAVMILSIWLPAIAAEDLLANAETLLPENLFIQNPRVRPVSAVAVGLAGGYVILFAGLRDLKEIGTSNLTRLVAGAIGFIFIGWLFTSDKLDVYSVVVEYNITGDNLTQQFTKHLSYVVVSLATGLVVGIGLGLWASRDENVSPIILYAVGIIQTIPSLALFGLLLVPLSNLGRTPLVDEVLIWVAPSFLVLSIILTGLLLRGSIMPNQLRAPLTIIAAVALAVPLALITLVLITITFQISFQVLSTGDYQAGKTVFQLALLGLAVLIAANRTLSLRANQRRYLRWGRYGMAAVAGISLAVVLTQSAIDYLPSTSIGDWTLSDVGIRGLGESPALVALTLYSLLPMTRNTYAGLNNVDPAIIDSGRGMGMTPRQIFFQIELPLAFPIIMAGVRNAAIALVGITTIAAVVGGGGLGFYVLNGVNNIKLDLILLGGIPAILLAFAVDIVLRIAEAGLTSPGIRQL